MHKIDRRAATHGWWWWMACLLMHGHAMALPVLEPADQEWRDRFVMGGFADAMRHVVRAEKKTAAALQAAQAGSDTRTWLRATINHLLANVNERTDCKEVDEAFTRVKAAGPGFERELFDLSAAAIDSNHPACATEPSVAEFEALARRLGDPARMYFVLQAKSVEAERAGRYNDAIQFAAQQRDYALTDFQVALSLFTMANMESVANTQAARTGNGLTWLQQGLELVRDSEYETLQAGLLFLLFRTEAAAGNMPAALNWMKAAERLVRGGALGEQGSAFALIQFARTLVKADRVQEALAMFEEGSRYPSMDPNVLAMRSSVLLVILGRLGTPEAHRRGLQALAELERVFADPDFAIPSRVAMYKRYAASFHEAFGDYAAALAALKAANVANAKAQELANETARTELREKLDVAAKDRENAQLKADAELQAARQRGWILAFAATAAGVLAAGAALTVAVRRGRRLAKVSAELVQRNDELEQRSASRIRLLAAACHDLRQPAHALGMLAELGSDAQREPAQFVAWLQSVRRSTASLGEMLDELMDLGRLDGGHYTPQWSEVPLAELLHDVMLHFGGLARRKGLTLEVPPAEGHIVSDRHLLRRILFNLVSNAIKYTDTGFVRVAVLPEGDTVQVVVQDSGPGIPQDKLDDVFRDYVRLNPTKAAEGLGIGLSIVRRAAELLGHELTLSSAPGEGTTVRLRLPRVTAPPLTPVGAAPGEAPAATHGVLALLENDVDVRDAMAALLQRWGYTVCSAGDAHALLEMLADRQLTPELIVTDLHLDGSDGLTEVAHLRQALHAPALPALLVTGDLDDTLASQAEQAQVYLAHKPLAPRKLSALVSQMLGRQPAPDMAAAPAPTPAATGTASSATPA